MNNLKILDIRGLTTTFGGINAVDGINFSLGKGEICALIGPNGAGKTTFFNNISGECKPSAGAITFRGHRIERLSPRTISRMGIARTFQVASVFLSMTVEKNLEIAGLAAVARAKKRSIWRTNYTEVRQLVDRTLYEFGLYHLRMLDVKEISSADQRILEIGAATISMPYLLLLDEPTAGVSPEETARVENFIRELGGRIAVIIVEHNMELMLRLADRIVVFDNGTVLYNGDPQHVSQNDRVRRLYLGEH